MIIALTGTPGSGKTTVAAACAALRPDAKVVHLTEWMKERKLLGRKDVARDSYEVDPKALRKAFRLAFADVRDEVPVLAEGHLAHHLDADLCLLLRVDPLAIAGRLRARGYAEAKVRENAEAEAMDVLAAEVMENFSSPTCEAPVKADEKPAAWEIDATALSVEEVARAVWAIVDGRDEEFKWNPVGSVAWPLEALPWL